jgi:hypothetical protein
MSFKFYIEKTRIFSCEHRVYTLMSFKSNIKKILYYSFKLKYLNQKVFHPTLKKNIIFFLKNIEYIYTNRFQISYLKKKPDLARVARVIGWPARSTGFDRVIVSAGLLINPDKFSPKINPSNWCEFNKYGSRWEMYNEKSRGRECYSH